MQVIAEMTMTALRGIGLNSISLYDEYLTRACTTVPLYFGSFAYGERYRELCADVPWFISSLASNTAKEAEGAERIWEMVSRTESPEYRIQLIRHAIDEARHARYYLLMIELAFPGYLSDADKRKLSDLAPSYKDGDYPDLAASFTPPEATLDEFIQMNIGEIRTRLHQLLLAPVIHEYCPEQNRAALNEILQRIVYDETHHVGYTAKIIDKAIREGEGEWVEKIMHKRWAEFNKMTLTERELATFD